jgi:hypothetical protein
LLKKILHRTKPRLALILMGENRKSFLAWIWGRIAAETSTYFKVGDRVKIYTEPVHLDNYEGNAELIEFVCHDDYGGIKVERWKVLFDNEIRLCERIISTKITPLLSGRTEMLGEKFNIPKNVSEKEQTGINSGADIEYDLAFKYPASMLLSNPRTGIVWNALDTHNLKGMKVLVHSDRQTDWVSRTNGVPVKATNKFLREVPEVAPKIHIFEIVDIAKDNTQSQIS